MNYMAGRTTLDGYGHSFYAENAAAFPIRDALRHELSWIHYRSLLREFLIQAY